jgi:hypothetical protein
LTPVLTLLALAAFATGASFLLTQGKRHGYGLVSGGRVRGLGALVGLGRWGSSPRTCSRPSSPRWPWGRVLGLASGCACGWRGEAAGLPLGHRLAALAQAALARLAL